MIGKRSSALAKATRLPMSSTELQDVPSSVGRPVHVIEPRSSRF
jgi:hypothetical protein